MGQWVLKTSDGATEPKCKLMLPKSPENAHKNWTWSLQYFSAPQIQPACWHCAPYKFTYYYYSSYGVNSESVTYIHAYIRTDVYVRSFGIRTTISPPPTRLPPTSLSTSGGAGHGGGRNRHVWRTRQTMTNHVSWTRTSSTTICCQSSSLHTDAATLQRRRCWKCKCLVMRTSLPGHATQPAWSQCRLGTVDHRILVRDCGVLTEWL